MLEIVCSYECKLCLTLHNNEGNYLAHTQGKRHQTNLAKRAAREAKDAPAQPQPNKRKVNPRKTGINASSYLSTPFCLHKRTSKKNFSAFENAFPSAS